MKPASPLSPKFILLFVGIKDCLGLQNGSINSQVIESCIQFTETAIKHCADKTTNMRAHRFFFSAKNNYFFKLNAFKRTLGNCQTFFVTCFISIIKQNSALDLALFDRFERMSNDIAIGLKFYSSIVTRSIKRHVSWILSCLYLMTVGLLSHKEFHIV